MALGDMWNSNPQKKDQNLSLDWQLSQLANSNPEMASILAKTGQGSALNSWQNQLYKSSGGTPSNYGTYFGTPEEAKAKANELFSGVTPQSLAEMAKAGHESFLNDWRKSDNSSNFFGMNVDTVNSALALAMAATAGGGLGSAAGVPETGTAMFAPEAAGTYQSTAGLGALDGVGSLSAPTLGASSLSTLPSAISAAAPEAASMYSLSGGTGALGAGSAAGTTAGMAGPGLTATAAPSLGGMGGGTGVLGSLGPTTSAGAGSAGLLSNLSNLSNIAKAGSSLYSAYQGQQGAKQTQDIINNQMTTLADMYKEGSPWAEQLKEQLARKDAAAGRNSQYGSRLAQYQALLADKAGTNAGILGQLATQAGAANKDSNSYLNLLLNRAGDVSNATGFTKYLEDGAKDTAKSAWDYFFG